MAAEAFPVISLNEFETADSAGKKLLALEVDAICRTSGFLAIADHGVPQGTIKRAWDAAAAFFDQPVDVKQAAKAPRPGYPYGYLGPNTEALAASRGVATPPDLKESFNGGPLDVPPGMTDAEALAFCYAPTIWPAAPQGFREAWETYYRAMEDLAARIMQLFAAALTLPEDYFAGVIDHPVSALRALNYPEQIEAPKPGQLRAGAHSDYGSLTILLPQPEVQYALLAGDLYMFSRSDGIVLGGTHEEGVWSLEPDLVRKQQILAGHQALFDGFRRCRASA